MKKLLLIGFILAAFAAVSPLLAQDPAPQTPSPEEVEKQKAELEKNGYRLLDQVINEAQSLRLPENRVRTQINAADLLWDHNQERARSLYAQAADSVADTPAAAPAATTLYDRLGGRDAIVMVVDSFVARVAADSRINSFFTATAGDPARLAAFKGKLVDQICQASGGPCTYTGKDMKTAHAGMKITNAHFDALVEDLVTTLKAFNVAQADQDTLLGVLGPMRTDIVAM